MPRASSCNDDANIITPYSNNWDGCNPVKKLSPEELKMAIRALKWHGIVIVHTKWHLVGLMLQKENIITRLRHLSHIYLENVAKELTCELRNS